MTKGQTSKLELQKKKKKGAAPTQRWQRALPAGWIQGDFLPSSVTENDVLELVEHGMVVSKSWRLSEGETEPARKEGERVLLLSHVPRGHCLSECFERVATFQFGPSGPPRKLALPKGERIQIQPLVHVLIAVIRKGVTGTDLLETFLGRRIQLLQARHHAMWHYARPSDSTRSHPEDVSGETVSAWVRSITGACDNPVGARRVKPFRAENPPPNEEWTNWHYVVSNGNPAEEEEGSQEGSTDSAEYVSHSGEMRRRRKRRRRRMGIRARHPHHQSTEPSVAMTPLLHRLLPRPRVLRQLLPWLRVIGA
ncbi:hypothetical protein ZWY2020_016626 [Hordeum vulgare]|nr:hypothetical protein ZWY2020_016626 [Hordeum vulgare]